MKKNTLCIFAKRKVLAITREDSSTECSTEGAVRVRLYCFNEEVDVSDYNW